MPSRNTLEIIIQGEDRASKVIGQVNTSLDTLGKVALGAVVGGITTASAAIAGFAARGISEFTQFQQGIAEVLTLIPDASEDMRVQLEDDVQRIAARFGTLPNEVIPAMYQAISAGVPNDNVFSFMEVASKAAIGGVTDLETAVDGITSVVNAYGAEVLNAENASDLLFTAVRLGKTDFTQLSNSLFNVVPTAASLNIGLEQVTASLASLTAQGTPTSVATTQLRQLFVEASKDGSKLSDAIQELAGKSFAQLTAEGGDVASILEDVRKAVGEDEFRNMFGSVEALNAALGLTGPNFEKYASNLEAMGDSAGATNTAFETMSKTIQFQANRLQAKLSNFFVNIGSNFEPFAAGILETIGDVVSVFDKFLTSGTGEFDPLAFGGANDLSTRVAQFLAPLHQGFLDTKETISDFFAAIGAGVPVVDALVVAIFELLPEDLRDGFNNFIVTLQQFGQTISQILEPIITWVQENVELKDVLIVIAGAIASVVIPAIASLVAGLVSFLAPIAAIIGAVALLRKAWETDFLGIRTFVLEKALPALQQLADWFLNTALPAIVAFVQNEAIPFFERIGTTISQIWTLVQPGLQSLLDWFTTSALPAIVSFIRDTVIPLIGEWIDDLANIWTTIGTGLGQFLEWFTLTGLPIAQGFIEDAWQTVQDLIGILQILWQQVQTPLNNLLNGIRNIFNQIKDNVIQPIIDRINEFKNTIIGVLEQLGLVQTEAQNAQNALNNVANNPSSAVTNPSQFYSYANGMEYVPRTQVVRVHQGEGILTREQNEARLNGEGGTTNNITIQLNGSFKNQYEADKQADMMISALRNRGIQLSRA